MVRRSLADRTQHKITNQNHTVLLCTRASNSTKTRHSILSRQDPTGSTRLLFARRTIHSLNPLATLQKARPTWHLVPYTRVAHPCPTLPCLASPLHSPAAHLTSLDYVVQYKVSIINPQPVPCPRPKHIAPLPRPPVLQHTHPTARTSFRIVAGLSQFASLSYPAEDIIAHHRYHHGRQTPPVIRPSQAWLSYCALVCLPCGPLPLCACTRSRYHNYQSSSQGRNCSACPHHILCAPAVRTSCGYHVCAGTRWSK